LLLDTLDNITFGALFFMLFLLIIKDFQLSNCNFFNPNNLLFSKNSIIKSKSFLDEKDIRYIFSLSSQRDGFI
jgi:hypothetical protein